MSRPTNYRSRRLRSKRSARTSWVCVRRMQSLRKFWARGTHDRRSVALRPAPLLVPEGQLDPRAVDELATVADVNILLDDLGELRDLLILFSEQRRRKPARHPALGKQLVKLI